MIAAGWVVAVLAAAAAAVLGVVARRREASLRAAVREAERLRAAEADERGRLAGALASLPEGVVLLDAQRRVLGANPAAERLLDVAPAEGKALWELSRDEALRRAAEEVEAGGPPRALPLRAGEDRHLTVSVAGRPGGGLVLGVQDSTEAVRYQELRKEFVANVSHELRTPLTVIRGYLETLNDGAFEDPEKGPEFLDAITRHAHQLSNLVESLLDLSRLESPQGHLRRAAVDLGALVARVAELHRPSAQRKGQTLEARVDGGLPGVSGDPDYLERAVANLVDNAVKYTPERGTIRITARRSGGQVAVDVQDDGIGIPAADLPRIFERFYRVDKSRSRSMGGTGLGLAIVKHIAQSHGGSVEVASAPGRGSLFRLLLPAA